MREHIPLQNAWSEPTKHFGTTYDLPETTEERGFSVIVCDFSHPAPKAPKKYKSIKSAMEKLKDDPDFLEEVRQSRIRIAEEFYSKDADTIKKLRLQKGWSQTELAKMLETSQPHIARIERDGNEYMQLVTFRKLCNAFNIDMNTLNEILLKQEEIFHRKRT